MSLLIFCEIVFFLGFGINHFYSNRTLTIVVAVMALIIGILLLLTGGLGLRLT
jgi:hypothetical protein